MPASSSDDDPEPPPNNIPQPTSRKVAASLELFLSPSQPSQSSQNQPPVRQEHSPQPDTLSVEEVGEAQFVKRAEWPDRENTNSTRRDKHVIGLDRLRAANSSRDEVERKSNPDDRSRTRGRDTDVKFGSRNASLSSEKAVPRAWTMTRSSSAASPLPLPYPPPSPAPSSHSAPQPVSIQTPELQDSPDRPIQPVRVADDYWDSTTDGDSDNESSASDDDASDASESGYTSESDSSHYLRLQTPPAAPSTSNQLLTDLDSIEDRHDGFDVFHWDDDPKSPRLPHVRLRPFRNQVGGHSVIYKFTRRAVCKPLVSRENLFYEAVEQEAPPLLGYIPRYLGVMLVNYRPVRRPSNASSSDPSSLAKAGKRPSIQKAATSQGLQPIAERALESALPSHDGTIENDERPEVVLDRNRHILPPWLLHGHSERGRRLKSFSGMQSTPELHQLSIPPRWHQSEHSSPIQRQRRSLFTTGGDQSDDENDDDHPQHMAHHGHSLLQPNGRHHSLSLCGGRGSTVVNTRLKDHVFGAIFKRLHKHTKPEGEGAGEVKALERGRPEVSHTGALRRVRSASHLPPIPDASTSPTRSVFDFDIEKSDSALRSRSRSRSADALHRSVPESVKVNGAASRDSNRAPSRQEYFILMEDLTARLKNPCVLDLKMGTRVYGIDATSAKRKNQMKKCDRTTSRALGVRHCGMQAWDTKNQTYVSQNKYFGRDLQTDGFKNVLVSFLHNGEKLLVHHIPGLLQQIYGLARIIYRLKGYRFYGCSLLFIYEGDREVQEAYLRSITDSNMTRSKRSESLDRQSLKRGDDISDIRRARSEDLLFGPAMKRSQDARRKRGEVMIRLVDFAHTTTGHDYVVAPESGERPKSGSLSSGKGYLADIDAETGRIIARYPPRNRHLPDLGFLFGLKNVASALEEIWNDERLRRSKASRANSSVEPQLGSLPKYGKDIFNIIFGSREQPGEFDPGMISS